jgi:hypothetical protein
MKNLVMEGPKKTAIHLAQFNFYLHLIVSPGNCLTQQCVERISEASCLVALIYR